MEIGEVKQEVKSKRGQAIQGLETYSREEIKSIVLKHIEDILSQNDIDAPIVGLEIIGSRNRGDAKKQSDLDVVVEYSGNEREDGLFNILNEKRLEVEGIKIDINPINKNKTGTLEEYLEKSNKYDKSQLEAKQAAGQQEIKELKSKSQEVKPTNNKVSAAQAEADAALQDFLDAFNDLNSDNLGIVDNTAEKQAKMLVAWHKDGSHTT